MGRNHEHPIEEWERLKDLPLPDRYNNNDNFRFTRCKATITNWDESELFFQRTKASVLVKFRGFVDVESVEYHKCDMGHRHKRIEKQQFMHVFERLTHEEARMLGQFLLGKDMTSQSDT